jgi:hypothetical protein
VAHVAWRGGERPEQEPRASATRPLTGKALEGDRHRDFGSCSQRDGGRALRRQFEALRDSHTLRIEAKPGGECRQGVDPSRQIHRLAPTTLIGDSERSPEIFERTPDIHPVLGGVKRNVEGSRRDAQNLHVDPADVERVRFRAEFLPDSAGGSADTRKRTMEVDAAHVASTDPRLGVAMPGICKMVKSELPYDVSGLPVGVGSYQEVGVAIEPSITVTVKPDGDRRAFEEQRPNSGFPHRGDDLRGDAVDMQNKRSGMDGGGEWRHG